MVRIDDAGNLFFYDRVKDMIKTGGMNVSSQEAERVLFDHPAVEQCGVVGLPDDYWSEAVTAFVVLADGADASPDEIIAHCKDAMAGYKVPKAPARGGRPAPRHPGQASKARTSSRS